MRRTRIFAGRERRCCTASRRWGTATAKCCRAGPSAGNRRTGGRMKQPSPIATLYALRALGVLWTLPNTLLGLIAGAAALAFGARVHFSPRECALVFNRMPWGPGGALTLGNTILHT